MLTVYGIETGQRNRCHCLLFEVATVLTVYGIETQWLFAQPFVELQLQQCLPFTVLKRFLLLLEQHVFL